MARLKIDYGIDLGTTNSAICRMEKGEPKIKKIESTDDTMPSCVSFNKNKGIRVGTGAYNNLKSDKRRATKSWEKAASSTFIEFKRTMATDTKYSVTFPKWSQVYSSEELSAEVLRALKSFITDENFNSAVITVPAKFTVNQKTATLEAAKKAGFTRCELLQEPIAAAMAYGLTADSKNGIWMVFDFGGGTFDAALLKVEDGIMQVFDTDGDNYLGGKNLDYAIVDKVIIPYLQENYAVDGYLNDSQKKEVLRDAMKTYAEDVKNQLSFKDQEDIISNLGDLGEDEDGEEIMIDITVKQSEAFDVMRPYFQKAVDICKNLLERNHLSSTQIDKLILVGGPTHSPLIRQMLREQITPNVDTSIDPMTAVATGAALYASTIDAEINDEDIAVDTVKLDIGYEATSVNTTEWVTVKLPSDSKLSSVFVELVRGDKAWSSGKSEIGKDGNVLEANLVESKPNSFDIMCYDSQGNSIPCFPNQFTIIQGSKVGAAPLPYNIGIAIWNDQKERAVFAMLTGLEKNKPVPAVGVKNDLKTISQLRPGVESDRLRIAIYQVDDFSEAEGRPVSLYNYVADVNITGDDVDELIPEDSSLDLTVKVDSSEQMMIEVYFKAKDISVEKQLDTGKKHSVTEDDIKRLLGDVETGIRTLQQGDVDTALFKERYEQIKQDAETNSEKMAVEDQIKRLLRDIDGVDRKTEWHRLEMELRSGFERLEYAQENLGNEKTAKLVEQLRTQVDQVIRSQNVTVGKDVLEQVNTLFFKMTMVYQCMGLIEKYDKIFSSCPWIDSARARQLIDRGLQIMNDNPTTEALLPIARCILDLLPNRGGSDGDGLPK